MIRRKNGYALGQALFIVFIWGIFFSLIMLLFAKNKIIKNEIKMRQMLSINRISHHRYIYDRLAEIPLNHWCQTEIDQVLNLMEMKTHFFPFGHFLRYQTVYKKGDFSQIENGLIANRHFPVGDSSFSLILTDSLRPYVVTPRAILTGNILTRTGPLKKGNFQGLQNGYLLPQNGKIYKNGKEVFPGEGLIQQTLKAVKQKSITTDFFFERAKVFLKNRKIHLSQILQNDIHIINGPGVVFADLQIPGDYQIQLINYVIIYSESPITIETNCTSSYALFISQQKITISGGNHYSQFMAPEVEINAKNLSFPTVVSSIPGTISKMQLSGNISGSVIQYPEKTKNGENQIDIKKNMELKGLLFCSNSILPVGKITGMAILKYTQFYLAPTYYHNWIDKFEIHPGYKSLIFPFSTTTENQPEVVQFARNAE